MVIVDAIKKLFGRTVRRPEILVLGDSHTRIFREEGAESLFPGCRLRVVTVGGATASGLANPNSRTQAYPVFKGVLATSRARVVVTLLGEVDAGFVIWYRSRRHNLPVRDMLRKAVESYGAFLEETAASFPVVCLSAPLPTISDDNDWGDVANLRKEVKVSQTARTEMTIEFNRLVEAFCRTRGICHVNLDPYSVGDDGLVRKDLLNGDRSDHHYCQDGYLALLKRHAVPLIVEAATGNH